MARYLGNHLSIGGKVVGVSPADEVIFQVEAMKLVKKSVDDHLNRFEETHDPADLEQALAAGRRFLDYLEKRHRNERG